MKIATLGLILLMAAPAFAGNITSCGQIVPPRTVGVLTADLDCSSASGAFAVRLDDRATLEMAGHTLTGRSVLCNLRCTIHGPGDVTGVGGAGLEVYGHRTKVIVSGGVSFHGNIDGIYGGAQLVLTDVDTSNNSSSGIFVLTKRVKGTNVTVNDNGSFGLFAQDSTITIDGLTANDNGWFGINGKRVKLLNSTLTGNLGGHPANPTFVDVVSQRRPRLVNTVCDHSLGPDGIVWGVCAQD